MTWDLDGKDAEDNLCRLLYLGKKSPQQIVTTLVTSIEVLQDLSRKEALTKIGWVRFDKVILALNKLIT